MDIEVTLSAKAAAELRKRAKGSGQDLTTYASGVLERALLATRRVEELTARMNASLDLAQDLAGQMRALLKKTGGGGRRDNAQRRARAK